MSEQTDDLFKLTNAICDSEIQEAIGIAKLINEQTDQPEDNLEKVAREIYEMAKNADIDFKEMSEIYNFSDSVYSIAQYVLDREVNAVRDCLDRMNLLFYKDVVDKMPKTQLIMVIKGIMNHANSEYYAVSKSEVK